MKKFLMLVSFLVAATSAMAAPTVTENDSWDTIRSTPHVFVRSLFVNMTYETKVGTQVHQAYLIDTCLKNGTLFLAKDEGHIKGCIPARPGKSGYSTSCRETPDVVPTIPMMLNTESCTGRTKPKSKGDASWCIMTPQTVDYGRPYKMKVVTDQGITRPERYNGVSEKLLFTKVFQVPACSF